MSERAEPDRVRVWTLSRDRGAFQESSDNPEDLLDTLRDHMEAMQPGQGEETRWAIVCWECTPAELEARWEEERASPAAS